MSVSVEPPPGFLSETDLGYQIYERTNKTLKIDFDYKFELPFVETWGLNPVGWTKFIQEYWTWTIWLSIVYLLVAFGGRRIMRNREPFRLDTTLVYWNWGLAVFSTVGCIRCFHELSAVVEQHGFERTLCSSIDPHGVVAYWHLYFAISKIVELGDTAFLVLRKRPLTLLHWYHHVTVLVYTWHSGAEHTAAGRWFIWMNLLAHSFMYSYYALRAMNIKAVRSIAVGVTLLQIFQMIVGVYITTTVFAVKRNGKACQQSYNNLYFASGIYFSYFLLFLKFFLDAYVFRSKPKQKAQ